MKLRHIVWGIGLASLSGSAAYLFVYLYRWEWNRADIAGTLLIVTEVALLSAVILARINRLERNDTASQAELVAADLLARNRPAPRNAFAWMRPEKHTLGVFIPVLIGAGAVISAVAWLVEWGARHLSRPSMERRLAGTMTDLIYPPGPLVDVAGLPIRDLRQTG